MRERLRPALAAALALLVGGDLAARGAWEALDLWRYLFPYLWLFLAFEALRSRRRLLDAEAFLLGAAVGLLHDGVYAKSLQEGASLLGIDWLGSLCAAFDWGMVAVLSLHAADALLPREETERALKLSELCGLVFLPAIALCGYFLRTFTGRYRYERMIGDTWLAADALFLIAAVLLYRRVLARAAEDEPGERDRGLWPLAAFCVWLPGAQGLGRLAEFWPLPFVLSLACAWGAAVSWWVWRLWAERGHADSPTRRAAPALLAAAGWRLAGALLVLLVWGAGADDPRSTFAFSLLVELPTRLVFAYVFLTSRVEV